MSRIKVDSVGATGIFHLIILNTAAGGRFDMFYSPLPHFWKILYLRNTVGRRSYLETTCRLLFKKEDLDPDPHQTVSVLTDADPLFETFGNFFPFVTLPIFRFNFRELSLIFIVYLI